MKKRLLSMLMVLCLMLTLAPMALAADTTVTTEEQLTNALAAASTGDTITLGANITLMSTVNVNKAVTINGGNYTLTAGSFSAIKVTASGVTIKDLNIDTETHGINFDASGLTGQPTLDVLNTNIHKITVDSQTGVCYQADCRGINTYEVKGGTINVKNCEILGFKYSINPIVDVDNSVDMYLRDGQDTTFNFENTTIKGWTALNMWSVNTNYSFKNCTLIGINNLSGSSNHFSTIRVNDGIYGSLADKEAVVSFVGGELVAVRYGSSTQAVIHAGYDEKTNFVFSENDDEEMPVICYYGIENEGAESGLVVANVWNFYREKTDEQYQAFLSAHTTGFNDVSIYGGTPSDFETYFG